MIDRVRRASGIAALACSIAGSGHDMLTVGLNHRARACLVVAAFPTAMLIMPGTFGLRSGVTVQTASVVTHGRRSRRQVTPCGAQQLLARSL